MQHCIACHVMYGIQSSYIVFVRGINNMYIPFANFSNSSHTPVTSREWQMAPTKDPLQKQCPRSHHKWSLQEIQRPGEGIPSLPISSLLQYVKKAHYGYLTREQLTSYFAQNPSDSLWVRVHPWANADQQTHECFSSMFQKQNEDKVTELRWAAILFFFT